VNAALGATFGAYFVILALLGYVAWRRTVNLEDYVLGGRRLGAAVTALSAGASDMSGWLLLGLPGAIFVAGLAESWIVLGLVVGAYLNWRIVAPRLRGFTVAAEQSVTLPAFLSRRLADESHVVRVTTTALIIGFFAIYTAAGLVAGAKLFTLVLGLDYQTALWCGVAVIMAYTALGGFLAVSWTDFFQALLMLCALVAVPLLAWQHSGDTAIESTRLAMTTGMSGLGIASLLAWGLGYFGQPHILARFMAIRSAALIPRARRIGMAWMVVSSAGAVAVGLIGYQWTLATDFLLSDPETIFIALSQALLSPWTAGIVLAAILAAVMSTVDSQLLVASTALVEDVVRPATAIVNETQLIWLSRGSVVAIALLAGVLASDPSNQVLDLVGYAWAGLGASLGPAILAALYWRRASAAGVVAGMWAGAMAVVGWRHLDGGLFDLYEMIPGVLAATSAIALISLLRPPGRESVRRYDSYRQAYRKACRNA
jgi:sodium/proline symporter